MHVPVPLGNNSQSTEHCTHGKTTRYLQCVIPTAIRTHNQQAVRQEQCATAGEEVGGGGGGGGGTGTTRKEELEECLGVNGRTAARVD